MKKKRETNPAPKFREVMLPKKREAFSAILRFMTKEDVELLADEEKILNRWIYCDSLLRAKEHSEEEIINKIVDAHGVSIHTARNDIYHTQQLFAKSRLVNKKYLIHHHLERIDRDIQNLRASLFEKYKDEKGEWRMSIPDAKEIAALAKMEEVYTYTLNSIPDDQKKDVLPPPIFQFILAPGQVIERPLSVADALEKADAELLKMNSQGVYEPETNDDGE